MSNAHESAYSALKAAAKAIEGPGIPTLGDFKDARDLAKGAHETLDAAYKLLSKGILHVVDGTDDKETAFFDKDGNPTAEAEVTAKAPEPQPEPAPFPPADLTTPAIGCVPYPDAEAMDVEICGSEEGEISDLENVEDPDGVAPQAEPVLTKAERIFEAAKARARDTLKVTTKTIRADFSVGYETAKAIMERLFVEGVINDAGEVVG